MPAAPETRLAPVATADGSSRCLVLREDGTTSELAEFSDIPAQVAEAGSIVWYDLVKPSPVQLESIGKAFDIHPVALEDARLKHERPKLETYDTFASLIVHNAFLETDQLRIDEICVLIGHDYIITIRSMQSLPIRLIEQRWHAEREELPAKSASLLYLLLDVIVDGYMSIADDFDEEIYRFERAVFNDAEPEGTLRVVLHIRRQLQRFRRSAAPLRDMLMRLSRTEGSFQIPRDLLVYFRDVLDHNSRVLEQIDGARSQIRGALDVHFSWQTQRQNEVLKQLTIVATIFLPLSYFTGFFGQNFEWMVGRIHSLPSFLIFGVGLQLTFVAALFSWMKAKRFI